MPTPDQGLTAVGQTVDQDHLPQRMALVDQAGELGGDVAAQLVVAARRRNGGVADVVAEVEVGVVHPTGGVEASGDGDQSPAKGRNPGQASGQVVSKFVDGERRAAVAGRAQHHQVDAGGRVGRALDVEETGVAAGQSKGHG
jgi:hypothetical protein